MRYPASTPLIQRHGLLLTTGDTASLADCPGVTDTLGGDSLPSSPTNIPVSSATDTESTVADVEPTRLLELDTYYAGTDTPTPIPTGADADGTQRVSIGRSFSTTTPRTPD